MMMTFSVSGLTMSRSTTVIFCPITRSKSLATGRLQKLNTSKEHLLYYNCGGDCFLFHSSCTYFLTPYYGPDTLLPTGELDQHMVLAF